MRTKYSIINSVSTFFYSIISFILLFINHTFIVKILGIEYTGINGLFSNILTILNLFELGVCSAITYILYGYVKKNDTESIKSVIHFYKKTYNCIALIILIIGLLLMPFLHIIVGNVSINNNIYIIYILFLISTLSTYFITYKRSLLIAYQRVYVINISNIFYAIILNILQIIIIYKTKNYYYYLIIKIVCIILENILIHIKINKDYPFILDKNIRTLDKKVKKDIINRIKALFIHKLSGVVTNGTDNIIISSFFGIYVVGICSNYNYIINTIKKIFSNIIYSTGASVGNLIINDNYEKNYEIFKRIKFLNLWFAIVTSICLLFLIEPFITIWLGKNYLLGKCTLLVLVINYFQTIMKSVYKLFKDSAGIWVEDKYIPLCQLSINLVTSIIFIKIIGLPGVFVGTIISSCVLWFYSYPKFIYKKLFNQTLKKYYMDMLKSILVFIFIGITTYFTISIVTINSIFISLLIRLIICLLLSNGILLLLFFNNSNYCYYISLLKNIKKHFQLKNTKQHY